MSKYGPRSAKTTLQENLQPKYSCCNYFLPGVKIVALFCTSSVGSYRHVKLCVFTGNKDEFLDEWTGSIAGMQPRRADYLKWLNGPCMLASPYTKQMVPNKCHKHERDVNQSYASGSDNLNGAEVYLLFSFLFCI